MFSPTLSVCVCVPWLACLNMHTEAGRQSIVVGFVVRCGGKHLPVLSCLASPEEMFVSKLTSLGILALYCISSYVGCVSGDNFQSY